MARSVLLLLFTMVLVLVGCVLYVLTFVGWAQMCWVLASGVAGATVLAIFEEHDK